MPENVVFPMANKHAKVGQKTPLTLQSSMFDINIKK
jgi:hypothetical protein